MVNFPGGGAGWWESVEVEEGGHVWVVRVRQERDRPRLAHLSLERKTVECRQPGNTEQENSSHLQTFNSLVTAFSTLEGVNQSSHEPSIGLEYSKYEILPPKKDKKNL